MHRDDVIYAQVLLLDNKIETWKICQCRKESVYDFKAYWKKDRLDDYKMKTMVFYENETDIEDGWNFNQYVYNVLAPKWINQWKYAEDYHGSKASISTLQDQIGMLESLNKAFGGRFDIIGQLGSN